MSTKPHVQIYKGETHVFLKIDKTEYEMLPTIAKQVGDVLFKTACDVQARVEADRDVS